jgi:hypothetical protein
MKVFFRVLGFLLPCREKRGSVFLLSFLGGAPITLKITELCSLCLGSGLDLLSPVEKDSVFEPCYGVEEGVVRHVCVSWKGKRGHSIRRLSGEYSTKHEEGVEVWITVLDDLSEFLW